MKRKRRLWKSSIICGDKESEIGNKHGKKDRTISRKRFMHDK